MAIKVPDNLMNRPMSPGGQSDGSEYVTRQFGNRDMQVSGTPNVPSGWGGVANLSAGAEWQVRARAVEQVTASVQDTLQYIENIKLADEDSRQKSMFLRMGAKTEELRKNLRADPNLSKQSEDVQQAAYEIQRDAMIDAELQKESFSNPKIRKLVDDNVAQFRASDTSDYYHKVLVPSMVQARKQRDQEDVGNLVGTAMAAMTPEATGKAATVINERFTSPEAYATYGANNAEALRTEAMRQLTHGVTTAFMKRADDEYVDIARKLGLTGPVLNEAITSGPIADKISDDIVKLDSMLMQAGANEGERLLAREAYQKTAQQAAKAAISSHNQAWEAQQREIHERNQGAITSMGDSLFIMASSGKASDSVVNKHVNQTLRAIGIDPVEAAEGRLTDPAQIKLYHGVVSQVARVNSEQRRVEREIRTEQRSIETLRLQREMAINPATQKGADLSFKDFTKSAGLGDKPPLAWSGEDWTKFNAYVARTSPTHLAAPVEQAINYGLNSNDPNVVKQSMLAYTNLTRIAPGLAAQLPVRTREIATRLLEGQDITSAKAAVDAAALRTPEQREAVRLTASRTIEQWKRGNTHPVAQALGAERMTPAVLAFANREYEDAIARGESPAVAQQTMLAKVSKTAGKSTLMSPDGKVTLTVNAPEVRFNVGVEKGPGWFAKLLGARDNPNAVPENALHEDLRSTIKGLGLPENQKFFLGQPVERGGRPFYPIMLVDDKGVPQGPAMKDGEAVLWTFDPENNPTMNKRRSEIAKYDEAQKKKAEEAAVQFEFKTLMSEAQRQGTLPKTHWEQKDFRDKAMADARRKVTGK